ncbi:MAG: UPF0175 family protein [Anaerolineae bacterium]
MLRTRDFVEARLYESEEAVVQDALKSLLRERPQLRIELAIHRYQTEDISLGKAANTAGVSFEQMKEILLSRGIQLRMGPETQEEALEEIATLRRHLDATSRQ